MLNHFHGFYMFLPHALFHKGKGMVRGNIAGEGRPPEPIGSFGAPSSDLSKGSLVGTPLCPTKREPRILY